MQSMIAAGTVGREVGTSLTMLGMWNRIRALVVRISRTIWARRASVKRRPWPPGYAAVLGNWEGDFPEIDDPLPDDPDAL